MSHSNKSNQGPIHKREDPIPLIRPAGKIIETSGFIADMSIRAENYPLFSPGNPGTPAQHRKFRRTTNIEPGKIIVHHGYEGLKPRYPTVFGRRTHKSDHTGEVIKAQNLNGLADKFNDIKESSYASNVREPLGRSLSRSYQWPKGFNPFYNTFGKPTPISDLVKNAVCPAGGSLEERPDVQRMYQKTHGNFGAGEQKKIGYNWNGNRVIADNLLNHSFGFGELPKFEGAKQAVMPERFEQDFPRTIIVKKPQEDFRSVTAYPVGMSKNTGQGLRFEKNRTFGVKNLMSEWNARKCIIGEATKQELEPDKDLRRSCKRGENRSSSEMGRTFGQPTIRTDIPYRSRERRSVADYTNFGDEPELIDLLFPRTFLELGLSEIDFQMLRSKEEIKELFEKIGYSYKVGKFNTIFGRAQMLSNAPNDQASVRAFMHAVATFHNVE